MVFSSETSNPPNKKKSNLKIRRPPINPLSFPLLGKSKSLLHLGSEKPCPPEPDYEEVGPPRRKSNADSEGKKHCDLCGHLEAAVRCEKCGSQAFCMACDEMYHIHPKRINHIRKAVDSDSRQVKPPLPPKGNEGFGAPPPQPPPRKNKKSGFLSSAPFGRRDSSSEAAGRSLMGSLKRIMGSRPLPPTPNQTSTDLVKRSDAESRMSNLSSHHSMRPTVIRPSTAPATPNSRESSTGPPNIANETNLRGSSSQKDSKYPTVISKGPPPPPPIAHHRKLSLQQLPSSSFEDKRASMVEANGSSSAWENDNSKAISRVRSQSISDEQWAQMMAAQAAMSQFPIGQTPQEIAAIANARRGFNTISSSSRPSHFGTRGMVSSASVCDLNSISQQQQSSFNGQGANSFQQLNMMGYPPGMMWPPQPCELCQGHNMGYPPNSSANGMKRTGSNLSMNLSSMGSEVSSGYPWSPPPHVHHMPFFPGYYPPPGCHSHMNHGMSMQGSAMSIPDSMQTFNKVPPSPAPSIRSSSHRSHKSSKTRSFSNADSKSRSSRNKSRRQSEESEESKSSSGSDLDDEIEEKGNKSSFHSSNIAWQCDHCTFINPGNSKSCGMCSKTTGSKHSSKNDKKKKDRRRDRRTDHEDENNVSDYDNDQALVKSSTSSKRDVKSKMSSSSRRSNRYRKKSRHRGDSSFESASPSISDIEDEERQLERQLKELRLSARSRQSGDYESTHRSRKEDKLSRRREGSGRHRGRGKSQPDLSRSAKGSPERKSVTGSSDAELLATEEVDSSSPIPEIIKVDNSSLDGTVVDTVVSEAVTLKSDNYKTRSKRSKSINSRASTPAPMIIEQFRDDELDDHLENLNDNNDNDDQLVQEVDEIINDHVKDHDLLQVPNKYAALSPRLENDEPPSFANTLDEIATIGTNEVADIDPLSQNLDDPKDDIDINIQEIEPIPEIIFKMPENMDEMNSGVDAVYQDNQLNVNDDNEKNLIPSDNPNYRPKTDLEPSYEIMNDNKKEIIENDIKNECELYSESQEIYQAPSVHEFETTKQEIVITQVNDSRKDSLDDEIVSEVVARLSIGSPQSLTNGNVERQFTPLSFSSSDAQFYSPPDSPDVSLSDKLHEEKHTDTMTQDEDFSMAQPDETTHNDNRDDPKTDDYDDQMLSAKTTAGRNADGYDTYSFQDAVSSGNTAPPPQLPIKKSASDQIISSRIYSDVNKQSNEARVEPSTSSGDTNKNDKNLTVQEMIQKRKQETMKQQGLELVQFIREAEGKGYAAEDVSVALALCGEKDPVTWLEDNWRHMLDTVVTLATNYGSERLINDVGNISIQEAKHALRVHKGNIWAAVTECVEHRQKKFNELNARGDFKRERVVRELEKSQGDVEVAYKNLTNVSTNKENSIPNVENQKATTTEVPKPTISKPQEESPNIPTTSAKSSHEAPLSEPDEPMKELEDIRNEEGDNEAEKVDVNKEIEELQFIEKEDTTTKGETQLEVENSIPSKPEDMGNGKPDIEKLTLPIKPLSQINLHESEVPETKHVEPTSPNKSGGLAAIQKASAIVGLAISKAMARDTPKKEFSISREASPHSPTTPTATTTTMSTTPASTPDLSEDLTPSIHAASDSDDDDLLRTLDTIPEEEEMSEMTESGRILSRSSSKNAMLPFNPTSVIKLPPLKSKSKSILNSPGSDIEPKFPLQSVPEVVTSEEYPGIVMSSSSGYPKTPEYEGAIDSPSSDFAGHEYYNTEADEDPVTLTPNDYETMYDVKRNLDQLRETSSSMAKKIDTIVSNPNTSTSGPVSKSNEGSEVAAKEQKTSSNSEVEEKSTNKSESIYATVVKTTKSLVSQSSEKIYATVSKMKSKAGPSDEVIPKSNDKLYASVNVSNKSTIQKQVKNIIIDSSGDSDEDEELQVKPRVQGLKAKSGASDYQEVRELKEQIQNMRRELQSQIEGRPESPPIHKEETFKPLPPAVVLQPVPNEHIPYEQSEEKLNFDRTVRRLLAEGHAGSYEKAELAAQLMDLEFDETDCIQAADECSSIYTAIHFLQQECELCAEKYPMGKMVSMLHCTHRCCNGCAKTYFTFQLKHKNISEVRCPFCNEPDLDNQDIANEYFNNLDILLKNILDSETHELFQRKLRDFTLMKDPNFKWCNKCSSGFIANARSKKLICPDCKDVTCAQCRKTWDPVHEGISCDAFARWQDENDPENQAQGVANHLAECGITCPKCRFTYALAKGGCMHFTCTQCKFEFCSGCGEPFKQGAKCTVGPYCEKLGLHAHHPRNCLFYLRDKEPTQLEQLLHENKINYELNIPTDWQETSSGRPVCRVPEQKETPDGLIDEICGRSVINKQSGLCRLHYTEYLVEKINNHKLDPVIIFDEADLRVCLRRNGKAVPIRRWESEKLYRDKLIKLIKQQLPLK